MPMIDRSAIRAVMRHLHIGPGCWEWTGAGELGRYGNMTYLARSTRPHRLMYEAFHGPIPRGQGLMVRHRCDNKRCARPSHLLVGTARDNSADARERGLTSRGERHSEATRRAWAVSSPERRARVAARIRDVNRRLTAEQVTEIRARLAAGDKQAVIATGYGVDHRTISAINCGHIWRTNGQRQ